jgi:hypothetical protein
METPIIHSFTGRNLHPEARAIFHLSALMIAPLSDGTFAVCDRAQTVYLICETFPDTEVFAQLYSLLNVSRMNAQNTFLGEPTTRELALDLKRASSPAPRSTRANLTDLTDLI